jgi:cell division protease FtsH
MEKKAQFSIWYFALALLAVIFLQDAWVGVRSTTPIPYSEFQTLVKEGKVADIAVHPVSGHDRAGDGRHLLRRQAI